eukprot:scaffold2045_cov404-Prasinococcus_capsulatus_cf.AAC.6
MGGARGGYTYLGYPGRPPRRRARFTCSPRDLGARSNTLGREISCASPRASPSASSSSSPSSSSSSSSSQRPPPPRQGPGARSLDGRIGRARGLAATERALVGQGGEGAWPPRWARPRVWQVLGRGRATSHALRGCAA